VGNHEEAVPARGRPRKDAPKREVTISVARRAYLDVTGYIASNRSTIRLQGKNSAKRARNQNPYKPFKLQFEVECPGTRTPRSTCTCKICDLVRKKKARKSEVATVKKRSAAAASRARAKREQRLEDERAASSSDGSSDSSSEVWDDDDWKVLEAAVL
jgi:hypothetical protein